MFCREPYIESEDHEINSFNLSPLNEAIFSYSLVVLTCWLTREDDLDRPLEFELCFAALETLILFQEEKFMPYLFLTQPTF